MKAGDRFWRPGHGRIDGDVYRVSIRILEILDSDTVGEICISQRKFHDARGKVTHKGGMQLRRKADVESELSAKRYKKAAMENVA